MDGASFHTYAVATFAGLLFLLEGQMPWVRTSEKVALTGLRATGDMRCPSSAPSAACLGATRSQGEW